MNWHTGRRFRAWRLDMLTGLAFTAVCGLGLAAAETYPDRPIKLVVPFGAGGPPDVAARIVAGYLSTHLGTVFIENRPGAGGTIAAKAVAAMPPDGYSLMLATSGALSISPQIYSRCRIRPGQEFRPDLPDLDRPACSGRQRGSPDPQHPGTDRLRQGEPGQAQLRGVDRHSAAYLGRDVQRPDRNEDRFHSLQDSGGGSE